jgi:hypothetical protein
MGFICKFAEFDVKKKFPVPTGTQATTRGLRFQKSGVNLPEKFSTVA